jgi:alpha-1,4-digalacturonate transport system substrate-binding protein
VNRRVFSLLIVIALLLTVVPSMAQDDVVEINITYYHDGNELEVLEAQLATFMEEHPNIQVNVTDVPYADLHTLLQAQVETGEAPDIARITFPARFLGAYLNLADYAEDPQYWVDNIPAAVLAPCRMARKTRVCTAIRLSSP